MEESNKTELEGQAPSDYYEHYRFIADPGQSPVRLDRFLLDKMQRVSRNRIQGAIRHGYIRVGSYNVKPNYKVRPGDEIVVSLPTPPKDGYPVQPENIPLDIRYEDDDLLIVHKSPGMIVHPGHGTYSGTLVNALVYHYQNHPLPILKGNFNDRPGLVHRIDKNTSGLLVVAKNDAAMTHLAKQFFNHTVHRRYIALVWGEMDAPEGTITKRIGRNPNRPTQFTVFDDPEMGKHAVTHYRVLEDLYYVSLIECRLETGRTHQIRVHMRHEKHPLFNDDRYDGNRIWKGTIFSKYKQFVENCFKMMPRHALHAKSLGFIHPTTGEEMLFDSELPDDFQIVLDKWRRYLSSRKNGM